MKSNPLSIVGTILLLLFFNFSQGQSYGTFASAVWITDCNQSNFFNTSGSGPNLIGPAGNVFEGANLGVHTQNSGTLLLRGAEVKTFKNPASSNVCNVRMYYRIYQASSVPGAFTTYDLPFLDNCNVGPNTFPSGGPCVAGDQKWQSVIPSLANLTSFSPGNYILEVYYDATGSFTSTSLCDDLVVLNNSGANYKANFSIQAPVLVSTNPSTCNGVEGSITINGLAAGVTYSVTYSDDGATVGPLNFTANASGQIIISGLNAGLYSNFSLLSNGCTTNLNTGIILSNPIFIPTFSAIPPFCAGSTAPLLPTTSNNGITGTWNPATVNNLATGVYTFTPTPGLCGFPVTITVTVNPNITPTFTFGTSLTICSGGTVPTLPTTSTNGITGTWNPSVVSNTASGVYTFTPTAGQCATTATFTVTVNPNITPTFPFGTTLTICSGGTVPVLPTTSDNGITGTWSPSVVSNTASGVYTFTPNNPAQCGTTTTFTVTVNPNITPTFPFGTTLTICSGGTVPVLPTTSDNGITGTWSPSIVSNTASGVYTFIPTAGQCATTTTFTVTVNPNITPTFPFGTTLTICSGGTVPVLPTTSDNGITGTWSPSTVSNTASGVYIFTPTAGLCATTTTFTVTVNPNITPTFSFGTTLTICSGGTVPVLPTTSSNGITGTWSPSVISNTANGVYTFTPTAGLCATTTTLTVTVTPNITPVFSFGTTLTICSGGVVPTLYSPSDNGITGTWSPSVVSNTASGVYTFTPTGATCATPVTFTVTVNPNITPTFSFGTSLTICDGGTVPALTSPSTNGITGTWSPSIVSNTASGVYTFTPTAGQCATTATFTVTVNPNITPTFSFGTTLTICSGGTVPVLPTTSSNGITGTWSPSTVSNTASGVYTFTPTAGLCATTTTFTVTVTSNIIPTFTFGATLTICSGGTVPVLPTTSDNGITGTWSPSTVSNTASGVYTFTPNGAVCATPVIYTVTVNPNIIPAFSFGTSQSICINASVPVLPTTSTNNIAGTWSPSTVSNTASGVYTFTPNAGQCVTGAVTFTMQINAIPTVNAGADTIVYDGANVPLRNLITSPGVVALSWVNSNPAIGLAASGTGNFIPSFTAVNRGNDPITATITVTPTTNGCVGAAQRYTITVRPLNKDVFVPNVFSPNGDGKNDQLFVYGNYIDKIEMYIYNQWGQLLTMINSRTQGWDGTHKGKPQPVGVYVYVLKAVLSDGRTVNLKGSVTLIR